MSPTGNFGSVTTRPSTRTPRPLRMCRASRAVSQTLSMSRRITPTGTLRSAGWGPGAGRMVQKAVFGARDEPRGAGSRFRCFFMSSGLLGEPRTPPRVRLVELRNHEVRGVNRPGHLFLVRLLDRDALDDDRPLAGVDAHDGPFAPAEAAPHDSHVVPLADGDGAREARLRLLVEPRVEVGREVRVSPV